MHFSYIYYISQYSYMFLSISTILRELYSKMIYSHTIDTEQAGSRYTNHRENVSP
jgi:hypothetical protein